MSDIYVEAKRCRMCGGQRLEPTLDLGVQALTGVFPRDSHTRVPSGPLRLVRCTDPDGCGLVQLAHSYDAGEMYGENYGYRSGLNPSMVAHLRNKVERICALIDFRMGDLVLDIGSNDGTTLGFYAQEGLTRVGMDPTGGKFSQYYPKEVELIADFFSAREFSRRFPGRKARVVTSFSMFYDLEDPVGFMRQVHEILEDGGIWVFEQSYMPAMLSTNSFDTVCHEHLEFYGLTQIAWASKRVGFDIVDVEFNAVNGGSFSIVVRKSANERGSIMCERAQKILDDEMRLGLGEPGPYAAFAARSNGVRAAIVDFLQWAKMRNYRVVGIGASTKGNVLLQYCGITPDDLPVIGEVNPDKFGSFAPGTSIPIQPEDEVLASNPDFLLILPWHFRDFFVANPRFKGRNLVFPLPTLEIVKP